MESQEEVCLAFLFSSFETRVVTREGQGCLSVGLRQGHGLGSASGLVWEPGLHQTLWQTKLGVWYCLGQSIEVKCSVK